MSWGDENTTFNVVINHEEQYSIWPDYKNVPAGWRLAGKQGKKEECLAWIDQAWTDMRPLSLRKAMDADVAGATAQP
ncbi:MbtH family protein [Paraburkholderia sediminicola]|uniref:MbtH family protein n=1 Tax=Paraburkholderia sediminicola TaxID=458836 RepID=UPI0038B94201